MVSDATVAIMFIAVLAMAVFLVRGLSKGNNKLIHKLYFLVTGTVIIWMLAVIAANFTDPSDEHTLWVFDSLTYVGVTCAPVFSLLISLAFTKGLEKLPGKYYVLFIIPVLTNLVAWTNPFHHLLYKQFSVYGSEVIFGPYIYVSGVFSYVCMVLSIYTMARYAFLMKKRLVTQQALLFCVGSLIPSVVNLLATVKVADLSIAATPLGFIATVALHGYAIFYYHMLDIKPIAMQKVLDWISDCYLVTDAHGMIIDCNKAFEMIFAQYGMTRGKRLEECVNAEDIENKTVVYNLLSATASCRESLSTISFEQSAFMGKQKLYFMVDLTPLIVDNMLEGFVAIFKDVTKLRDGMQRLHDSQARLMEQERLASLGQMVGGLAHNLKTPIMSISGSSAAIDNLIDECVASMGDRDVTEEDYREIYFEMRDWLSKMRDACAYMSDIITAVKGQAANITADAQGDFSTDELMKRVSLLLRHELQRTGCKLEVVNETGGEIRVHGDVNSLVQVVNNLVSNAAFAMQGKGGGMITVRFAVAEAGLRITVEDRGIGIAPDVKNRLFRQMITNKGTQGTGLGVYISNTVIKAKFGGRMWAEDNPGGGAVFGLEIPPEYYAINDKLRQEAATQ
ncbi:MAG TPA: histidine kinase N-terminal 7TM domain-containing protein [Clostridia bacterium]|nr:histidine kinase N-terminal 7TM domain-containing protein [Clostridia bacterium]